MNNHELIRKVREFSRMAYSYNIDPDEVESEALAELYHEPLSEMDNPEGFVFRAVKNTVIDLYRKEKRRATPVAEFYDNEVGGVEDRSEYDGLIDRVREHVVDIVAGIEDERYKSAVTGYYLNGLSTAQVAELMGVPKGTVLRLLYEARNSLSEGQVADLLTWDDFNTRKTQYNNRGHDEGASGELIAILREEGYLL